MVNENEYVRPTMPYYQFYQQPMQMPIYYNEMYDDRSFYYQPNMAGAYMPPMNGGYMPHYMNGGYTPSPMSGGYMPTYLNDVSHSSNAYYTEPSTEGVAPNRVMQQFLDENGQVDIQKMLKTVGQFADTVQQVSPVIKQLNDLVRSFRA